MKRRPDEREPLAPGVLTALLLIAFVGGAVWLEAKARQHGKASRAGEARAEAALAQRAREYGDAVLATGATAPTDDRVLAIADEMGVEVREIHRTPDLSVVLHDAQGHGPGPLPTVVTQCHRITFRHPAVATPAAQVELLPTCPTVTAIPTPSRSGS
ncbi:hypothetical protein ACH4T9_05285 [Micromonospora sp. NPDC020750]|uniref:hypothetical protein n=1 Tax=unclassified Micromonospora TaxID=2617518 RepID=UPI003793CE75